MVRILVIDDDPDMRSLVEEMLSMAGYEVSQAADGREGVDQYCTQPADLVILDIFMPNQEGLETIRELRTRFPSARIIAMSGRDAAATMLSIAKKLGAIEVLQKPFGTEALLLAVNKALGTGPFPAK